MSLPNYAMTLAKYEKLEDMKLILEVVRVLKEYIMNFDGESSDKRVLKRRLESFEKLTSEFIEVTEPMSTYFKYINSLIECIPEGRNWQEARKWFCAMVNKFVTEKVVDSHPMIVDYVESSYHRCRRL